MRRERVQPIDPVSRSKYAPAKPHTTTMEGGSVDHAGAFIDPPVHGHKKGMS